MIHQTARDRERELAIISAVAHARGLLPTRMGELDPFDALLRDRRGRTVQALEVKARRVASDRYRTVFAEQSKLDALLAAERTFGWVGWFAFGWTDGVIACILAAEAVRYPLVTVRLKRPRDDGDLADPCRDVPIDACARLGAPTWRPVIDPSNHWRLIP